VIAQAASKNVCIAAILRDEECFVDEWIAYHRMIGVQHFYIYDDAPASPLVEYLRPHADYVTVVPWYQRHLELPGRNRQTKAYTHAWKTFGDRHEWIAFIDADEFLVFPAHANVDDFLAGFDNVGAVSLHWHVFGHNGFFDDPQDLVTAALTRRMSAPGRMAKTISRCRGISSIDSAHFCAMKRGFPRVDANKVPFADAIYPGKTERGFVNHYSCRSFVRWMNRTKIGAVAFDTLDNLPAQHLWRVDENACLRRFVELVSVYQNEQIDTYMHRYSGDLRSSVQALRPQRLFSR